MKAQELRIGNYIQLKDPTSEYENKTLEVSEISSSLNQTIQSVTPYLISFYCIENKKRGWDFETEFFKPIPLTEEWLLKFGFASHNNNIFSKPLNDLDLKKLVIFKSDDRATKWGVGFADYYTGKETSELLPTEIMYAHQLQNLYFALTGEELELKEPMK